MNSKTEKNCGIVNYIFSRRTLANGLLIGLLAMLMGCASDKGPEAFKNLTAPQILKSGEKELSKNNYKEALKRFEAIDALYPFAKETEQAEVNTIYAYYKSDDVDEAIAAADRYIHLYPKGARTDYAYYMKGMMNFDRGKNWFLKYHPAKVEQRDLTYLQQAFVDFNDLVRLFPQSVYVKEAYQRMAYIRNLLAQHELNVAQYYFDRQAYVAAANRASFVVKHYERTPQVLPALKIMIKSYNALGATGQANETMSVMHANYPHEKV